MADDIYPYAPVILKLLNDILYYDDKHWEMLLSYQTAVRKHFAGLGLVLHIDAAEGYAYLEQPDLDPDAETGPVESLPRLVRRMPLTYDQTLLCVLLREQLQQFDTQKPDETRLILAKAEIQEMLRLFYPEQADMTRLYSKIDRVIGQVERLGFLKKLTRANEDLYEVRRIIKAKISADKLVEIRDELRAYAEAQAEPVEE